jgi:uncharacterized protein with ATP-grasp and redox domains
MKISLECIPCLLRQSLEAARFVTDDTAVHEQIVRHVLRMVAEMDLNQPPPVVARAVHRRLREMTGVEDPYRTPKARFNRLAMSMLPDLAAEVERALDPLLAAARLAIAGNMIDLGANWNVTEAEVHEALGRSLSEPFVGNWEEFREAVADARDILYLADNAGEIVLDRLLIQELGCQRITLAVRGSVVINDATLLDAEEAGLHELVEVIDNGSDAPGTILEECNAAFRKRFSEADLIIAKGQGSFETLSDVEGNIFFLFKVKCPVIASHVGLAAGTHALVRSKALLLPPGLATARV